MPLQFQFGDADAVFGFIFLEKALSKDFDVKKCHSRADSEMKMAFFKSFEVEKWHFSAKLWMKRAFLCRISDQNVTFRSKVAF